MTARPISRPAARLLVLGPGDVLLLFNCRDDAGEADGHYWITPGGGIQPGELAAEAAVRELREETGVSVLPSEVGPVVAYSTGQWSADGQVFDAHDSFFLVRVHDTKVDTAGQEDLERSLILGHRWWDLDELAGTREQVLPPGVAGLFRSLLTDGLPVSPVRLPWRAGD